MGYDVRLLHGIDWRVRRRRTAMEMLQESFSDDPNSDMYYGSTGRTPSNSAADGFIPLTAQVMRWLDFPARARTGIYDALSLNELDRHCITRDTQDLANGLARGRYDGSRAWRARGLHAYISMIEQADWRFENPGQATEPARTPAPPPALPSPDDIIELLSSSDEDAPSNPPQDNIEPGTESSSEEENSEASIVDLVSSSEESVPDNEPVVIDLNSDSE